MSVASSIRNDSVSGRMVRPVNLVKQVGEFGLSFGREQQVIEGTETTALVGLGDAMSAREHLVEQFASGTSELLITITSGGVAEGVDMACLDPCDLTVNLIALAMEFGEATFGVVVGPVHELAQQIEDRIQPRLGADKGALMETVDEIERELHRGSEIVVRFVAPDRIVLAEPAMISVRPFVKILAGRAGIGVTAELFTQGIQFVVEGSDEFVGCDVAVVGFDECAMQEGEYHRCVDGGQHAPRGMEAP